MFRKILIATDLSLASDEVICTLGGLRAVGTREALLLRCLNLRDVGGLADRMGEAIEVKLGDQGRRVAALGFKTETKTVTGLPQKLHPHHPRAQGDSEVGGAKRKSL